MQVVFLIPHRINIGCVANILVKQLITVNLQVNLQCICRSLFKEATFNLNFILNEALQNLTLPLKRDFHSISMLIIPTLERLKIKIQILSPFKIF